MSHGNVATWQDPDLVPEYAQLNGLLGAEPRILDELRPRLGAWSMLDVGVGAGRTTAHFAPAVADYLGVDISRPMIERCRRRFGARGFRFEVADARELSALGPARFDFVLFSFNGLDNLGHEDRLRALAEVRAVCRPGAVFCFSSHNLQALPQLMPLRAQYNKHPVWLWRNLSNWLRWRVRHAREVARVVAQQPDWAVVNDGAHDCRLHSYYVRPSEQVAQLDSAFEDTRVFAFDGRELTRDELADNTDNWLYYLCRAR